MYEASKGRHWPPLAQGLEAHGSACWQVFPGGQGGERVRPATPLPAAGAFPTLHAGLGGPDGIPSNPQGPADTAATLQAGDRGSKRLHNHPGHTLASRLDPACPSSEPTALKTALYPPALIEGPCTPGRKRTGGPFSWSWWRGVAGAWSQAARTRQLQGWKGHGDSSRAWGHSELFPDQRPRQPQGSPGRSLPASTARSHGGLRVPHLTSPGDSGTCTP